jgi:hypothetical protein
MIAAWFSSLFNRGKPYRTIFLEDLPDNLKPYTVYILGEGEYLWSAAMLCPCGCGEIVHISLHKEGRPRWEITNHKDGTVSFKPSIWRKDGCKSHFFLERGLIRWC